MASSPFGFEPILHYHSLIKKNYHFSLKHFVVQSYSANHPKIPNSCREKSHSILGQTIFKNNVQLKSMFFMVYLVCGLQKNAHKLHFQVKCKVFQSLLRRNKMTKIFNIVKVFECCFGGNFLPRKN